MNQVFGTNFILDLIEQQIKEGLDPKTIRLRFPPEPNGFLHIGHARAICLNFHLAQHFGGSCYLRFDDTNPKTETKEFTKAIKEDIQWLGFKWDRLTHSSDYFSQLFDYTLILIKKGLAYVDDQTPEEVSARRGTLTTAGTPSPWRNRSTDESIDLLEKMRSGEKTQQVVRAKIDMAANNLNLRDPIIWRQSPHPHYRLGTDWNIFPLYDFSHPLSDAIEGITHSLCTLEFADHRPLYDWFLEHLIEGKKPQQIEFSRMNIQGAITSKREIAQLINEEKVWGYDDPRLVTLTALRRRGFSSDIIKDFCFRTPITKAQGNLELDYLYTLGRDYFNAHAERRMAVLKPLKVTLTNFKKNKLSINVPLYPQKKDSLDQWLKLTREIYIEQSDFSETDDKNFFGLTPNQSVNLRFLGSLTCESIEKNDDGSINHLRCSLDVDKWEKWEELEELGKLEELGELGNWKKIDCHGRKIKTTIHWINDESILFDSILLDETDSETLPSLEKIKDGRMQESLFRNHEEKVYQFRRIGYFKRLDEKTWIQTLPLRASKK